MKPFINASGHTLFISAGWFRGEPLVLFQFRLLEKLEDMIVVLDLRIARAALVLGFYW